MADRLAVDTDGLSRLSGSLSRIADGLDSTRRLIDGARDDFGSAEVFDALDDFENNWDDGREQIMKNLTVTREILDESVKAYEQTDEDLATELNSQFTEQVGP